ncbi:hypothetical protein M408DRAFT_282148 [Serendipita vermifera MAFF 305830]|uniref:NAD-dependent epimerase/dehydratase domain-containing protein n=1 Tax=Serendipita vermifera MAFF 305830 TaxID=933852 RepID=A0A0C2W8A6_SERVB|nr:hypothetical protein M408DRAFT_282148 [Serendipita vermifera MAFF 305830]
MVGSQSSEASNLMAKRAACSGPIEVSTRQRFLNAFHLLCLFCGVSRIRHSPYETTFLSVEFLSITKMATKPNVLVFGGLTLLAPILTQQLIPPLPAEPLVSHIRIVDKFLVNPPTTRIPKAFIKTLQARSDLVEYRQANLTTASVVSKCFMDPAPNGLPYTHIIDCTGESFPGHESEVYIKNTFNIALLIARTSAAQMARVPGSIKAHIRIVVPWYKHPIIEKRYKETDPEGWQPKNLPGAWWHESLRAVGSIKGLPFVVVRCGSIYGESFWTTEAITIALLALIYKHMGREMKLLWSPNQPKTCINNYDFVGIIWKAAEWISTMSREEANAIAGAPFPPSYDDSVTSENCPDAILASAGSVTIPCFNAVDETNATQASLSAVISRMFGIEIGFLGSSAGALEGKMLEEAIKEANEVHLVAWSEIIMKANPPVPDTPLMPYLPPSLVTEDGCGMDGERVKNILKYNFRYPRFDERAIRDYINWCRNEGIWPETDLYTSA